MSTAYLLAYPINRLLNCLLDAAIGILRGANPIDYSVAYSLNRLLNCLFYVAIGIVRGTVDQHISIFFLGSVDFCAYLGTT
jgi:hypothetical protein